MVDIIGAGRVGQALHARATARGSAGILVTRTTGWSDLAGRTGTPLIVATRNDDLATVIARVPDDRRDDLAFVQNGALTDWLASQGMADATRGILYFAVPARGDDLTVGDPSPWTGPHAQAIVDWLGALDVPAAVVDRLAFREVELEKLLWNCVFGLVCEAHQVTVGEACRDHGAVVAELTRELLAVGERALGVDLEAAPLLARLQAYSLSIPDYRGAVKEWRWRNGWFVTRAQHEGVVLPVHDRLVASLDRPELPRSGA